MTITRINDNTLILEIDKKEFCEKNQEEMLHHILNVAVSSENLNTRNCAFLLEGVESKENLVFLLTIKNIRRTFKIKKNYPLTIYSYNGLDDFISCICALYNSNYKLPDSSTYTMDNCYYISFKNNISIPAHILITQYGEKIKNCNIFMGRLREYGHILTKSNSVNLIGSSFICK